MGAQMPTMNAPSSIRNLPNATEHASLAADSQSANPDYAFGIRPNPWRANERSARPLRLFNDPRGPLQSDHAHGRLGRVRADADEHHLPGGFRRALSGDRRMGGGRSES